LNLDRHIALQFYQNLGKLFYAIVAADNSVRVEEMEAVKELVKEYWQQTELGNSNSKTEFENIILDTFNWLCKDNEYSAEACFDSFISFKQKHESIFTKGIKSLILNTTAKISASFSGQNKSELILLAKLNIEFQKGKDTF